MLDNDVLHYTEWIRPINVMGYFFVQKHFMVAASQMWVGGEGVQFENILKLNHQLKDVEMNH